MGWMQVLYETYNNCSSIVADQDSKMAILLPVAHSTANAQLEITVDIEGNFVGAKEVSKEDTVTIIPVTEDSNTRSSGIAPHPLCDKLCYLAGDYEKFVQKESTKKDKGVREYFEAYINNLKNWCESPKTYEKVQAIFKYLIKETVIKDLMNEQKIEVSNQGIMTSAKIQGISQSDVFVRFCVEKYGEQHYIKETWKDKKLFNNFTEYYMSKKDKKAFCYVVGKDIPYSDKHPAKIRNSGDKAKLLSSNDTSGYTFRGRFVEANEAASIGYEVSQKAHSALRWLIKKQGTQNGSAYIVTWATNGVPIPDIMKSAESFGKELMIKHSDEDEEELWGDENEEIIDTAESYAIRLNQAIHGYKTDLSTNAKVVLMSVDTADGSSQGRLAITFYRELRGSIFFECIEAWHKTFYRVKECWKNGKITYQFIGAPTPKEIARTAFGIEQNNIIKVDDKIQKKCVERMIPCIVLGRNLPKDIVQATIHNAGRPMSFTNTNWNQILMNACAILMKYENDREGKGKWNMSLNENSKNRSYLFGRLLAIADYVECRTFEKGEDRVTNAKRYMTTYVKQPMKFWAIIYEKIQPYFWKLKPNSKFYYENAIEEIMCLLQEEISGVEGDEDNGFTDEPLDGLYLLGFYHQRRKLREGPDSSTVQDNEREVEEHE